MPEPELSYWPDFLPAKTADDLLSRLLKEIAWTQGEVKLFGRLIPEPRLSAWYGDADADYSYSGKRLQPLPWTPLLSELRHRVEAHVADFMPRPFNSVLLNLYRDGHDSMGLHSDDERELGPEPVIASVSLGAPRRFVLRHKLSGERHELLLDHGSLLLMYGRCQHDWKHGLPKHKRCEQPRVNLTFRWVGDSGRWVVGSG